METFLGFMQRRQEMILDGKVGHDSKKAKATYLSKPEYRERAHAVALVQAEASMSDPFTYSRVISHISQGATSPYDYDAKFGEVRREFINPLTGKRVKFKAKVPHNQAHP